MGLSSTYVTEICELRTQTDEIFSQGEFYEN